MTVHRLGTYRACEAALRRDDLRQALYDAGGTVMADVLLTLHGPAHAARRAVEARVFRRNFFRHYEHEVFRRTLDETLAPLLPAGRMDLIEFGYRVTANLTADFAGIDRPARTPEETAALIALVKTFSEGATMVHSTRDPAAVEAEVAAAMARFRDRFFRPSVARRRALLDRFAAGAIGEAALPRDVLTVVLRDGGALCDDEPTLLREMAFYLQAGAHSTANATVHAFDEIRRWSADDPAQRARLAEPGFVRRCVHESLRLHPASPEAWRAATAAADIGGIAVAPTDRIVLDLFAANRDPAMFGPTAGAFDPDRRPAPGQLAAGLSFGAGPHSCLGRELDGGAAGATGDADGIVPLLVVRLLDLGARVDPHDPPTPDARTSRPNWGRYPVVWDA